MVRRVARKVVRTSAVWLVKVLWRCADRLDSWAASLFVAADRW